MMDNTAADHLREFLRNQATVTEVQLGDALVDYYRRPGHETVFTDGRFWRYDPPRGVYAAIDDAEVVAAIYDIDRAAMADGQFKVTSAKANNIVRIVRNRLTFSGFFRDAAGGIAVMNGFLTVEDGRIVLRPHSSEYRQRDVVPLDYDPKADTSVIDDFLRGTFDDPEISSFLYEAFGVALFGEGARYHTIIMFHGAGNNGKGVILKVLQQLFPANLRSSVPPSEWMMDYQRTPLINSRLNTVGEMPTLTKPMMETLKNISAGDTLTARHVRSTGFEFQPKALHIFSSNGLPPLPETGESIERRFRVVRFGRIVPEYERDPHKAEKLFATGGKGLLRRAVEAFERVLQRNHLANPRAVQTATLAWIYRSDPVRIFTRVMLEKTGSAKHRISAQEMFDRCCEFCNQANLSIPSSKRSLNTSLEELGYSNQKASSMHWIGVRFLGPRPAAEPGASGAYAPSPPQPIEVQLSEAIHSPAIEAPIAP
jgi:P4 family phage/plasmid primase-like protien